MQGVWVWFLVEELRSHMPERNKKNHGVPPDMEHCERQACVLWCSCANAGLLLNIRELQAIPYWGIFYKVTGLNLSKTLRPPKTRENGKLFQTETKVTRQDNQMQSMVREWIFLKGHDWDNWQNTDGVHRLDGSTVSVVTLCRECSGLRNAHWCVTWSQASCLIVVLKELKKKKRIQIYCCAKLLQSCPTLWPYGL